MGSRRLHWQVMCHDQVLNILDDAGFPAEMSLCQFRERLYAWTGISPASMRITLSSRDGHKLVLEPETLNSETLSLSLATLSARLPSAVTTVSVTSTTAWDGISSGSMLGEGDLVDSDGGPTYEISECAYAARPDTYRAQKQQLWAARRRQLAEALRPGVRCFLEKSRRTGCVAYVGPVPSLSENGDDIWAGVVLDTPDGKHDGRAPDGTRYFTCAPLHGVFVRPERIQICVDAVGVDVETPTEPDTNDIPIEV
ncbi:hypothetical protein CCYA_CCYA20G4828 [Cyanidiococcus yangmingshanensis]|nr:hypothetical protein CCYA_CCYA20G4828 [Cyanidiococcus yangmingshanensis]